MRDTAAAPVLGVRWRHLGATAARTDAATATPADRRGMHDGAARACVGVRRRRLGAARSSVRDSAAVAARRRCLQQPATRTDLGVRGWRLGAARSSAGQRHASVIASLWGGMYDATARIHVGVRQRRLAATRPPVGCRRAPAGLTGNRVNTHGGSVAIDARCMHNTQARFDLGVRGGRLGPAGPSARQGRIAVVGDRPIA